MSEASNGGGCAAKFETHHHRKNSERNYAGDPFRVCSRGLLGQVTVVSPSCTRIHSSKARLLGPKGTPNDSYFDMLQLAWMATVDFGLAWELACLEKIHLGCRGQQLTRTATYSTDHIRIRYMSNRSLISDHPCIPVKAKTGPSKKQVQISFPIY